MKPSEQSEAPAPLQEFLLKLSHDVRSPLGAILGFNELLKANDLSDEEVEQFTSAVERNAKQILALLDQEIAQFKIPGSTDAAVQQAVEPRGPSRWPSILIVEDSADTRELISIVASDLGSATQCVPDAESALAALNAGAKPDLVLLDLTLPGMTGEAFLKVLRTEAQWKNIKVVLLSGWEDLAAKAAAMGADGSLKKPFDVDDIEALVRTHAVSDAGIV